MQTAMMVPFALLLLLAMRSVWCDNSTIPSEYSCASCTEVKVSELTPSGYKEKYRFSCPSDTAYCSETGSCSPLPTLDCAPTDSFQCMQDGVFPHPTDCQKFRVCRNGTSYLYVCPAFRNYDSYQGTCALGALCYTISCAGKTGTKVPYGNDASIYAYCLDNVAIFIERCPGSYKLNVDAQKCLPSCLAVGNKIPHVDDCTRYYSCSMEPYATQYTVTMEQCPDHYGFDPSYLRCVPLKTLPSCIPKKIY